MSRKITATDLRVTHEKSAEAQKIVMVRDSWPTFAHERAVSTSGLSCMLVVIKKIYSVATEFWDFRDIAIQNKEQRNPFLAMAWRNLSSDNPGVMKDLVHRIWEKDISSVPPADLMFENIVSSPIMCETLWSDKWFSPFSDPFWRRTDSEEWHMVDENAPQPVLDLVQEKCPPATPKSFRFEATPDMNLSEAVAARFGSWRIRDLQVAIPKSGTFFFFATFDVKNVTKERVLEFERISKFTFHLPEIAAQGDDVARPAMHVYYNLAAIVFHRQQPTDLDSLRIYEPVGIPRVPIGPEHAYAWPSVRVSDLRNGDSFFALYAMSMVAPKSNPSFPEDMRHVKKREPIWNLDDMDKQLAHAAQSKASHGV